MFFVFLSLLEFAAVNSYMRQSEKFEKLANALSKGKFMTPPDTPVLPHPAARSISAVSNCPSHNGHTIGSTDTSATLRLPTKPLNSVTRPENNRKAPNLSTRLDEIPLQMSNTPLIGRQRVVSMVVSEDGGSEGENGEEIGGRGRENGRLHPTAHTHYAKKASSSSRDSSRQRFLSCAGYTLPSKFRRENSSVSAILATADQEEQLRCIQLSYTYSAKGLAIDKWSRWLFPLCYALFNAFYWIYYLWYIQSALYLSSVEVRNGGGGSE